MIPGKSGETVKSKVRVAFSTKNLEPSPGDMLRDPAMVYARAEETAQRFRSKLDPAEVQAPAQQAAQDAMPEEAAQMEEAA